MGKFELKNHLTTVAIRQKMQSSKDIRSFQQWQILYSVSINPGVKSESIAGILGVSSQVLLRTVKYYNLHGVDFQEKVKWGGRRAETSFQSLDEEKAMMEKIRKIALEGKLLTYKDVKKHIEQKLSKKVSDDYIWDLFKRHNWSKKSPRPKHPKQDPAKQEEFKKNSPKSWQPAS